MAYMVTVSDTLSLGFSSVTLAGLLAAAYRIGQLDLKVNTMWDFTMRRGFAEAMQTKMISENSPLQLSGHIREILTPFVPALKRFYTDPKTSKLDERGQFIALERLLGERMLREVCIPLHLKSGACVWAAMVFGKELAASLAVCPLPAE